LGAGQHGCRHRIDVVPCGIALDQPLSALALHTEVGFRRANMNALKMAGIALIAA